MKGKIYFKSWLFLISFVICNQLAGQVLNVQVQPVSSPPDYYEFCAGEEFFLQAVASGGTMPYSYLWTGNGAVYLNDSTLSNVTFMTTVSGVYTLTVTVTDASLNSASQTITLNVKPLPNIIGSSDTTICMGQSVTLWGANAANFLWFDDDDNIIGFGPTLTITPASTTTYILFGITNGCGKAKEITVEVNQPPLVDAGPDQQICVGGIFSALNATASNYSSIMWTTSGDGTFSNNTVLNPFYLPGPNDILNGSVTLAITAYGDYPCPESQDQLVLNIFPLPNADAGPDQSICQGESATLTASGGTTYVWSTTETTSTIVVTPTASQTYFVTVTDNDCSSVDSVFVEVRPEPVITITPDITICIGDTVLLTVGGGTSYMWSTGDTTTTIQVAPIVTTTYNVTVTENSCSATASVLVSVNDPVATITPNTSSICLGSGATITAGGGVSFIWNTGDTTSTIMVYPVADSTYSVTVTDAAGCSATTQTTITVEELSYTISPDTIICEGESTTISVSGGASWIWSNGAMTSSTVVSPLTSQFYYVTVTEGVCIQVDSVFIDVIPLPIVTISNDTIICEGEIVPLWVTGGGTYLWSTADTTSAIFVQPGSTTTYFVQVSLNSCSVIESVTVTVNPSPVLITSGNTTICENDSVMLWVTGADSYFWSTIDTSSFIIVSPTTTTTYSVTGTNLNGCSSESSITITVLPPPVLTITPDTAICFGDSLFLNVDGAMDFIWNTGEQTAQIVVTPATQTTYSVTGTIGTCSASASVTVDVNGLPLVDAGVTQLVIQGDSVFLNPTIGGTGSTFTCLWVPADGLENPNDCSTWAFPDSTTTYTLFVINEFDCSGFDTVSVVVYPPGVYIDAGNDVTICEYDSVMLNCSIILGNQPPYSFSWTPSAYLSSDTIENPFALPPVTTMFYVTVTDSAGQSATDSVLVTVIDSPNPDAGPDVEICFGESATLTGSGIGSFLWSTGDTISQITVTPFVTTDYILTVDNMGCVASDTVNVLVKPLPEIILSPDQTICRGDTVDLFCVAQGDWIWNTGDTTGLITVFPELTTIYSVTATLDGCENTESTTVFVNQVAAFSLINDLLYPDLIIGQSVTFEVIPDIFTLYAFYINEDLMQTGTSNTFATNILQDGDIVTAEVTDDNSCTDRVQWVAVARVIPNGFTPNGDGVNDLFMSGVPVTIVNRWGTELYNGIEGWDGKFENKECPAGTYFYLIEVIDNLSEKSVVLKGSVLLIR